MQESNKTKIKNLVDKHVTNKDIKIPDIENNVINGKRVNSEFEIKNVGSKIYDPRNDASELNTNGRRKVKKSRLNCPCQFRLFISPKKVGSKINIPSLWITGNVYPITLRAIMSRKSLKMFIKYFF